LDHFLDGVSLAEELEVVPKSQEDEAAVVVEQLS
jgi:hypothetical protein